jgi:hypothetical protein
MFQTFPIVRSLLTEVQITADQGAQINFQDYQLLKDAYVYGVQAFDNVGLTVSPNRNNVVPLLSGITLTVLSRKYSEEVLKDYPTYSLCDYRNGGIYKEFTPVALNIKNSYVTIQDATGLTTGQSVCFNWLYVKNQQELNMLFEYMKAIKEGKMIKR